MKTCPNYTFNRIFRSNKYFWWYDTSTVAVTPSLETSPWEGSLTSETHGPQWSLLLEGLSYCVLRWRRTVITVLGAGHGGDNTICYHVCPTELWTSMQETQRRDERLLPWKGIVQEGQTWALNPAGGIIGPVCYESQPRCIALGQWQFSELDTTVSIERSLT